MTESILIASDHAGAELKAFVIQALSQKNLGIFEDLGPPSKDTSVDYPDNAERLAKRVAKASAERPCRGILICGSGIGMSIAANKVDGIRAALVENPVSARLSREHNDANVLCLGARFVAGEYAAEIIEVWLKTPFSGGPRHQNRIDKIKKLEETT